MKMVCVLALVVVTSGEGGIPLLEDTPQTFCGRHLANARMLYCYEATANMRKRANLKTSPLLDLFRPKEESTASTELIDQLFIQERFPMPSKRNGIVEECCFKPCYISDLLNYC